MVRELMLAALMINHIQMPLLVQAKVNSATEMTIHLLPPNRNKIVVRFVGLIASNDKSRRDKSRRNIEKMQKKNSVG